MATPSAPTSSATTTNRQPSLEPRDARLGRKFEELLENLSVGDGRTAEELLSRLWTLKNMGFFTSYGDTQLSRFDLTKGDVERTLQHVRQIS